MPCRTDMIATLAPCSAHFKSACSQTFESCTGFSSSFGSTRAMTRKADSSMSCDCTCCKTDRTAPTVPPGKLTSELRACTNCREPSSISIAPTASKGFFVRLCANVRCEVPILAHFSWKSWQYSIKASWVLLQMPSPLSSATGHFLASVVLSSDWISVRMPLSRGMLYGSIFSGSCKPKSSCFEKVPVTTRSTPCFSSISRLTFHEACRRTAETCLLDSTCCSRCS
mmetsp:Transcript_35562/g.83072  ORF Transcript_35562/g.83072 Transcript_35562/m.83072 type:complete len:226 (+) Transcript_35562:436-1113(+)